MASMSLESVQYGPIYYEVRQGGNLYILFDVHFDTTPPAEFTYTVKKTMTDTIETGGQSTVPVAIYTPGTVDNPGSPLPFGGYKMEWELRASGYTDLDTTVCHGPTVGPGPCDPCKSKCEK